MERTLTFLSQNYKPLIASLVLALLLWIVVTTDRDYTTKIEVPLKITRLAPGHVLLNIPPQKAVFEIRGKGRALIGLNFYNSVIELELPEIDQTTTIELADYQNRFNIARELGVEIVDILEPKLIKLEVDRFQQSMKPVEVRSKIKPLAGYILISKNPERDSVLLSGPKSLVDGIEYIYSNVISAEGVKYPFHRSVPLVKPKEKITSLQPDKIDVDFKIEQLVERAIYNIPIQFFGVPPDLNATATPPNISIRVKGGESLVSALQVEQITAVYNYAREYKPGKNNYKMQVEIPANISLISTSPETFKLQLKREENSQ